MATKIGQISTIKDRVYFTIDTYIDYYHILYKYTGWWNNVFIEYDSILKYFKIDGVEYDCPKRIQMSELYIYADNKYKIDKNKNKTPGEGVIRYDGDQFTIYWTNKININGNVCPCENIYLVSHNDIYYVLKNKLYRLHNGLCTQEKYDSNTLIYMSNIGKQPIYHGINMCKYINLDHSYVWEYGNTSILFVKKPDQIVAIVNEEEALPDRVLYLFDKDTLYIRLEYEHNIINTLIINSNTIVNSEYIFVDDYIKIVKNEKYDITYREFNYTADEFYINDEYVYFINDGELYSLIRRNDLQFVDVHIDNV